MQRKYWLRGLTIGGCLSIFVGILFLIFPENPILFYSGILSWNISGIYRRYYLIPENIFYPDAIFRIEIFISILFWALTGLILGWLYGKIKNRAVFVSDS